jgi:hypothetical protein
MPSASSTPPGGNQPRRPPKRSRVRSLITPIAGSVTASHTIAIAAA